MLTLAIECATEACSVALFDGKELVGHSHEEIGRGHAERLIPAIEGLPGKGRADRILVSLGPGSFTGVRIGLAAARALGLAWQAQVLGYPTLALLVSDYRQQLAGKALVCMNGGHGEWFVQEFDEFGIPTGDVRSLSPQQAAMQYDAEVHHLIVGSKASELASACGVQERVHQRLPDARLAMMLPEALIGTDLAPNYGRAPDAKPQKARTQ